MGTVAMVASGKDGLGKSTLSVFLGAALAGTGASVLVIELDDGFRSVDIISGVYTKIVYTVHDVLSERCEAGKAIIQSPINRNLYVMSAPYAAALLPLDKFTLLCEKLKDSFDYILIDCSCRKDAHIAAAQVSDRAIVVSQPDPVSVRDSRAVADELAALKVTDRRLVINRLVPQRIVMGIVPHLDYCVDNIGIRLLGVIPELDEIALAAAGVAELQPKGLAVQVFRNIAERFLGNEVPLVVR